MPKKKKSIITRMKDQWPALSILGVVIGLGFSAGIAWSNQNNKYVALEQRITQVEKAQATMAGLADKMFDHTMALWNIEPDMRKKWKDVPKAKPDSMICGFEWTEFKKLIWWLHYRYDCDSLGVPTLQVDTLHIHKPEG